MLKPNYTGHRKDVEILENYFNLFKLIKWPRYILEIGIDQGGSLRLWNDLFAPDLIVGLDNATVDYKHNDYPIETYYYQQPEASPIPPEYRFDLIIDDASHVKDLTIKTVYEFWPVLNNVYVIEDYMAHEMNGIEDEIYQVAKKLNCECVVMSNLIALIK